MQSETDYQGAGPFPLIFQRSYNSLNVETTTIGSNWRHSYERSITAAREGKGKNAKQVATAHRPDGKEYKFVQNGSEWVPDPDVTDKLAQTSTGWSYLNSSNIMEEYDNAGQLVMLTNLQGLYQTLEYDPNGRLVSVQDQFGRALSFTYNTSGRIGSITDPAAGQYSFAYNAGGNLQSVTYPDLSSRVYLYENTAYPHALTGIVDENNVRYATWKYDAKGRAIASSHAGEADIYALAYFADPVTAVTEPSGIVRRRGYEVVQGVAKKTTLDNGCQTCGSDSSNITYDTATGFITSRTDFNGNRTEYIINARGLEESRTEGAGSPEARTITTAWHPDYRLPVLVTESDKETRLDYAGGKLIKKTEKDRKTGEVRAWSYTYNAIGLLETADGPRTDLIDVTRFNYDTQGNLQFMINPLNQTVTLPLYNENGQPLRVVDPNGLITDITYNSRRLVKSITTGGEQTAYEYDSVGNLRKVSFPDGVGYLTYQYDDAHRRIGLSDQLGNRIKYTLTANGDITKEEALDPGGVLARSRSYVYNQLGRLVQEINAAGLAVKKYDYYGQGNLKSTTDAFANTTNYHFDALNRLVAVVDPLTKTTGYSYDGQDSLQQVVDPNNVSTFYTNNGFGEVLTEDSPDSGFTTYTYDQAGNVAAITDANSKSTIFTYDALNRVVSATHADGSVTTYLYDSEGNASGRLVEINDQAGRTLWVYDQHGRVVGKSQTVAGVTLKIGYRYDESGRMVAMTYPSGAQIGYVYANGQLAGLTLNGQPLLTNVSYEPFGPVAGWTWANNQHQSYQHDLDGYLARHSYGAGLRSLGYDENGRVRSSQDSFQNLLYQYNAVGRLETVTGGQPNQTYRYDANGNRKELVEDASVYAYTFENGSNRIASISGPAPENFTHDAAGNRKSDGSHVYSYDAGNRLSNVDNVAYATNALNLRVAKQAPATTVLFVYDEQGRLRGEYDSSGAAIQETIYLDDIPVATLTGGHVYYIQADHLNSPRIIMDTAGRIVWHWISDPFGTESPDENPDLNGVRFVYNLRFPGQYYDEETGLHYNWHRYYDPLIGRYLTPDPIGLEGGVNLYSYVQNNPVNLIDPWGLFDSYTHKLLTSGVLAKYTASEKVVSRVNQGNVFVDRPENFKNNNEHGMRNFSQSRDDAMLASYNFQKAKMRAAIEAASKCDFEKANFELGQGLHSVQDEIAHDFISLPGHGNPEYIYRDAYSKTDKYSRAKVASEKYVERFVRNLGYHPF
ncbi:MAG: hypothetical protein A2521_11395 [Deltaproteobacteria bacterium RIFOXYD12_FULL_57_12]|nr:MAG: hypothetical protein A2521_11395 [Deltaproteobacteria bacterium RIFOXYD12_FULL_57_12]